MPYADPNRQREYQRRWLRRRREQWFADKQCVDCGSTENLELDHVDRETKVHHAVWSWSKPRRERELAKCVARCCDCHLARTAEQMKEQVGEAVGTSKLTEPEVLQIKKSLRKGSPTPRVAEYYNVHRSTIWRIATGRSWTHVAIE